MTVAAVAPVVIYNENGATKVFAIPYQFIAPTDLVVERFDPAGVRSLLVFGVDYSVSGGNILTGQITTAVAKPINWKIRISRNTPRTQPTNYTPGDTFPAETHERALDREMLCIQELRAVYDNLSGRALQVPEPETVTLLPNKASRLSKMFGWDLNGNPIAMAAQAVVNFIWPVLGPMLPSGGGGGTGTPGGNVMSIGLFVDAHTLTVATGTDIVQTSGYDVPGRGHALYIADAAVDAAYVAAYPRAAFITVNARGFRLSPTQRLDVLMFGAVGDDATDNLPAFNAARDYSRKLHVIYTQDPLQQRNSGASIYIPQGKYFLSSTWQFHHAFHVYGDGCPTGGALTAMLRFGNNCHGIVFHELRTTDDNGGNAFTPTGLGTAAGGMIEGLAIWGGNGGSIDGPYNTGTSPQGCGIRIRCPSVTVQDCWIGLFGEDAINIDATSGAAGYNAGNANTFMLKSVWCEYNGGFGCYIGGSDANSGLSLMCNFITNARGGLVDYSFLGNTHVCTHTRDNCIADPTGCNKPTPSCMYGGQSYYVMAGKEVLASTVVPGTDPTVWRAFGAAGTPRTWVTGMTWSTGAPYQTNPANVNARTVFVGSYQELGQPWSQITYPCIFLSGSIDLGILGPMIQGNQENGITANGGIWAGGTGRVIQFGERNGDQLRYFSNVGIDVRERFVNSSKNVILEYGNSYVAEQWSLNNDDFTPYGPYAHLINRLMFGNISGNIAGAKMLASAGFIGELTGKVMRKGDVYMNASAVSGQPAGWVCTTAGTFGSGGKVTAMANLVGAEIAS